MIYFIPWVVFLLVVILSVPIASWMDKRKMQAAYGSVTDEQGGFDDEADESMAVAEQGAVAAEDAGGEAVEAVEDFGGGGDFGDEDLSAFEEIR